MKPLSFLPPALAANEFHACVYVSSSKQRVASYAPKINIKTNVVKINLHRLIKQTLLISVFKFRKENQEKRAQRGSKLPHLKSQKLPMYKAQTKSNSIVADKVQAVQIEKKKRPTG
jgi:hypothetical protein